MFKANIIFGLWTFVHIVLFIPVIIISLLTDGLCSLLDLYYNFLVIRRNSYINFKRKHKRI